MSIEWFITADSTQPQGQQAYWMSECQNVEDVTYYGKEVKKTQVLATHFMFFILLASLSISTSVQVSNNHLFIYLIPLFAMVSALHTPFPFTSNGTPLYVATHWSLVWRSGWICSQIFFFGLSSFSGSPVSKQRITS